MPLSDAEPFGLTSSEGQPPTAKAEGERPPEVSQLDWRAYPGFLDVDIRYKLKAQIHKPMRLLRRWKRQNTPHPALHLFSHENQPIAPLDATDIPLVAQIRNGRRYLPSFLAHYRKLGVTRFIFVDDGSEDGSVEYLASMADVDLYTSDLSYMESGRGILFKEEVIRRYGTNRWWVVVDIDEYLIFEDSEDRTLKDLTAALEGRGIERLLAPLLDMYPHGDVDAARFDGSDSTMPWEVAGAFDRTGYFARFKGKDWEVRGGMRYRVFKNWVELAKFPLIYVRDQTYFRSIHYPRPAFENSVPILGNLLHFKIFDDYAASIERSAIEGRHFGTSKHYRLALNAINKCRPRFYMPGISQIFIGSRQLLGMCFFKSSN